MFIRFQDAVSILNCAADLFDTERATRATAVSSAKILIAKAGRFIGGQAIQLHGAIGLTQEHEVGQYYLRFLVFERMFGDANFHLERYEKYRLQAMLEKP
jgi:alkylation response protein AidB-like acyl-CoA dehydrogenase